MFGFLLFSPIAVALYATSMIELSNLTAAVFFALVGQGIFNNVISDYLWARACLLTSPTVSIKSRIITQSPLSLTPLTYPYHYFVCQVATVGISLTIPLAAISDFVIHHKAVTIASGIGGFMVLVGFILVNGVVSLLIERRRRGDSEKARMIASEGPPQLGAHP